MKYPIGIQSFAQIREDGYVYVDKTALIYNLVTTGKIYFLSRPRRFGKSLLVSTLKNYFLGKKELFKGLAIEGLETEWAEYPVFHIDFNGSNFTVPGTLEEILEGTIKGWEREYGKSQDYTDIGKRFAYVLKQAHEQSGKRCVVLIDEYDKPILDVLDTGIKDERQEQLLEDRNREVLKGFYSVFKAADDDLQFVLLTGVTKFSQVSVFSGFNQPADISMDSRYEALCGVTQAELEHYFSESIQEMAEKEGITADEMMNGLKLQYDGYHFGEKMTDVYNPFSLLNAFASQSIRDYWFRSGTPSYLIRLLAHTDENLDELTGKYYDRLQSKRGETLAHDLPKRVSYYQRLQAQTRHFPARFSEQRSEERLCLVSRFRLPQAQKGKRKQLDTRCNRCLGRWGDRKAAQALHLFPCRHSLHHAAQRR